MTGTSRRLNYPPSKRQEPFQPGSSPVHLQHRYMVWNNVGIVRSFNEEESSTEVEFHDTSVHHGLHIPNTFGHTMAALSTQALLLACPAQEESGSKLVCVNFAGSDGHKEWSTTLPMGEEALALAIGDSWLAVATSRRILRFYSILGLQRGMISLPGQIVCLAGHTDKLLITFHTAMGMPGEQSIGYVVRPCHRGQTIARRLRLVFIHSAATSRPRLRFVVGRFYRRRHSSDYGQFKP